MANLEELENWRDAVGIHMDALDTIINDRKILKNSIEAHLKSCFDWDDIEYNKDFTVITLKWEYGHNPVIRHENISELNMDWIIRADYDDEAFRIVVVEVYPFGINGEHTYNAKLFFGDKCWSSDVPSGTFIVANQINVEKIGG